MLGKKELNNGGDKVMAGFIMSLVVLIIMFVLLFDGHAIRKQNEELKSQTEKILAELEYLKNK